MNKTREEIGKELERLKLEWRVMIDEQYEELPESYKVENPTLDDKARAVVKRACDYDGR